MLGDLKKSLIQSLTPLKVEDVEIQDIVRVPDNISREDENSISSKDSLSQS